MQPRTLAVLTLAVLPMMMPQPAPAAPTTRPASTNLPVTKVQLFSSGVGYFEHSGIVHDAGSAELRFTTDQINDILKSLVLQDEGGGQVSAVTYPSNDPLEKTLKSFAVDITKNPSLAELLDQLRGASVSVDAEGGPIFGVVMGIENQTRVVTGPPQATITEPVLNLLATNQIVSKPLSQVRSVELADKHLQDELNRALAAVAAARDLDKKPVTILFTGTGDRHVRIGYVVQTPVWKTSYRLLLDDAAGVATRRPQPAVDGNLQGWAIVENETDNDWADISLSLVSGRPISFVQDLYQPRYLDRPTVDNTQYANVQPQLDLGGRDGSPMGSFRSLKAVGASQQNNYAQNAVAAVPLNMPIDTEASVQSIASTSVVGELFQYTVDHVSLPRRQSSMIPIVTDPIEVQRVSIYNPSVLGNHPLNGARVTNTTKKHLLAGPVTVLDGGAYAGDAQIDNLPPGQRRLLSYGIDLQTFVDATHQTSAEHVKTAKIVKGVMTLTRKWVRSHDYVITNHGGHDKMIVIESPREEPWKLVDVTPTQTTTAVYRFDVPVAAGKDQTFTVNEQQVQDQSVSILETDPGTIDDYRRGGEIPQPVMGALAKAAALKQAASDTAALISRDKAEETDIATEQSRLRDNLKAVQPSSTYYERLMKKLDAEETRIDELEADQATLQKKLAGQQQELVDYVNGLNVG